jgi:assimilatory nitrate reductase catalytic subunit
MFADWDSPEAVFGILKRLSAGRPCDFTGIADYHALDTERGTQWPYPAEGTDTAAERRLFSDGRFFHPDGRACFIFDDPQPTPEPADEEFPFLLLTGRGSAAQWHTQTRTSKSAVLRKLYPSRLHVEIHPDDAQALNVMPEDEVVIESRRGRVRARAFVSATVARGHVFLPMHDKATNRLTAPVFDAYSRQPSYKACAVRVQTLEMSRAHTVLTTDHESWRL